MCKAAWENAYTERGNRTIKEEYLKRWEIKDYSSLVKAVNKAVTHYNAKSKHEKLGDTAPVPFEQELEKLPIQHRPKMTIYKKPELRIVHTK